jgi:hypothetical protein
MSPPSRIVVIVVAATTFALVVAVLQRSSFSCQCAIPPPSPI